MSIQADRIISKLDSYLHKNDYASAEKHLLYWLGEAEAVCDMRISLLIKNELMGLYRKQGMREEAISCADSASALINKMGISSQVGGATTLLNCATVYKAFELPERSIEYFERARVIYEKELDAKDGRLGGLYNNMALTLSDLGRFGEARELDNRAIEIMRANGSLLEVAITLLNLATLTENELGAEESCEIIDGYLDEAEQILDEFPKKDGYYAFVCEKCASVYGYYGRFFYERELTDRARRIYEGS